jgi:3-hydroxybutyryl-CoA dehydrogenase
MKVSVIGSGTMGNGIAHVFAMGGHNVTLIDVSPQALDKALSTISKNLDRMVAKGTIDEAARQKALTSIVTGTSVKDASSSELVIEAATESVDLKLKIFGELDQSCDKSTILASNTSSISITRIGAATNRPGSVIGMHFMNPVPVMKLVEVIRGYSTSDDVTQKVMEISRQLGKTPVEVNDYPGFVANRILMPMINEAIIALHEGVAGVAEIDEVMRLGMAHPMGPLQLADFIGLDVCLSILNVLREGLGDPKYSACPRLVNMVAAGQLGVKSGRGFYDYSKGTKDAMVAVKR